MQPNTRAERSEARRRPPLAGYGEAGSEGPASSINVAMSAATAGRKPNSVPRLLRLRTLTSASARVGEATIIPLAPSLLTGSSGLPGSLGRVVRWALLPGSALPYLALLRAGFCLPRLLPGARCALTAPFHPCLFAPALPERPSAVCFLCHFPSSCPDRALPGALPCGVRTFLPSTRPFGARSGQAPQHSVTRG